MNPDNLAYLAWGEELRAPRPADGGERADDAAPGADPADGGAGRDPDAARDVGGAGGGGSRRRRGRRGAGGVAPGGRERGVRGAGRRSALSGGIWRAGPLRGIDWLAAGAVGLALALPPERHRWRLPVLVAAGLVPARGVAAAAARRLVGDALPPPHHPVGPRRARAVAAVRRGAPRRPAAGVPPHRRAVGDRRARPRSRRRARRHPVRLGHLRARGGRVRRLAPAARRHPARAGAGDGAAGAAGRAPRRPARAGALRARCWCRPRRARRARCSGSAGGGWASSRRCCSRCSRWGWRRATTSRSGGCR